jgi:hypothetical protein
MAQSTADQRQQLREAQDRELANADVEGVSPDAVAAKIQAAARAGDGVVGRIGTDEEASEERGLLRRAFESGGRLLGAGAYHTATNPVVVATSGLFATNYVPILDSVRYLPGAKEFALGALIIVGLTGITSNKMGAAYSVGVGMVAAMIFNAVSIPLAMTNAAFPFLALTEIVVRVVTLLTVSPLGFAVGGAVGATINQD